MEHKVYSVSEVTASISAVFQEAFPFTIMVRGEIIDTRPSSAGHVYFSLVEGSAKLACVMFKSQTIRFGQLLKKGDTIVALGTLNVYAPGGTYSLVVKSVEPDGEGARRKELLLLKKKLEEEGLFAPEKKRPLPFLPQTVGIVTAKTGAAVRDIVRIIRRRNAGISILLSPCAVQGEHAPREIAEALARLNMHGGCDVIIIGRGGGASEDLSAFNDELVVRAVASSAIPTVSAVGHQIDITLTDLAADARAETPSAAAELLIKETAFLAQTLHDYTRRCINAVHESVAKHSDTLAAYTRQILRESPEYTYNDMQLRTNELCARLQRAATHVVDGAAHSVVSDTHAFVGATRQIMASHRSTYEAAVRSFVAVLPSAAIDTGLDMVHRLSLRLTHASKEKLVACEDAWKQNAALLTERNPLQVLRRGYAKLYGSRGTITSVDDTEIGEALTAELTDGTLTVEVIEKRKND